MAFEYSDGLSENRKKGGVDEFFVPLVNNLPS